MREALVRVMLLAGVCAMWSAPASAAETLGATNVVTGSKTAYVDVELPEAVTVALQEDPAKATTFKVAGGGTFGGVALVQLDRGEYPGIAMAGRFDPSLTCDGSDCRDDMLSSAGQSTGFQGVFDPSVATLGKGRYRLFVISDGTPVTATISLPELSGRRDLAPSAPTFPHTVAGLTPVDPIPTDNFDIFAGRAELPAHGVILMTARINTVQNTGEVNIEVCNYEGTEPQSGDFQPGCGQTNDHALYYGNTYITGNTPVSVDWVFELPKGTWRTGGNVAAVGGIESSTWSALWLPTDGPSAPAAPAAPAVETPAGPPKPPDTTADPAGGRLTIATKARVRKRSLHLSLRCAGGPCRGTVSVLGARAAYDLEAGGRHTLVLRTKRRARRGRTPATVTESGAPARRITLRVR